MNNPLIITIVVVVSFLAGVQYVNSQNKITNYYEDGSFVGCSAGAPCND